MHLATGYAAVKGAGRLRGQGPHLNHPNYRTALTRRRPELKKLEDSVTEVLWPTGQQKRIGLRDGQTNPFEWQETMWPLLRHVVVLLAMKHGRAPLPVSFALWKGLLRHRLPGDLEELGNLARRFLFLGDGRMLLAELKIRTTTTPHSREAFSKESKITAEDRPQLKDAR
jgi:hypothetical protein